MPSKVFSGVITILIFFSFLPLVSQGASLDVVINEIAWMGTAEGANYEWIELYNNKEEKINLSKWKIENAGAGNKTLEISTGEISPKEFFLICKKEIRNCDFITGALSLHNEYEKNGKLVLKDNLNNVIDQTPETESKKWPAGDNKTKQTMERAADGAWQTSAEPGGTPKAENSEQRTPKDSAKAEPTGQTEQVVEKESETGSLPAIYPAGIVFNEILPSPEGSDAEEEWIEIFNQNNFEVNLSAWKIKDKEGKTTTFVFPEGTKISPLSYLVLLRPETKITLNNSNDGLELINPNGEIVNLVTFEKAALGQSYNKTQSGWVWSTVLTPEKENIIPLPPSKEKLAEVGPRAKEKTETGSLPISQETAAIAEKLSKKTNYLSPLLIAFTVAIFSAIVILILKKISIPKSSV